jgi:hypothetical protein
MTPEEQTFLQRIVGLGLAGLLAGLGALIASKETLTTRAIIGRALTSVPIGIGSSSLLIFYPNLVYEAQVGIACFAGTLGASGIERLYQKYRG